MLDFVLVVIAIAVVAAGLFFVATALFGPGEPPAPAGEPVASPVPMHRPLTGDDLRAAVFTVTPRGYRMADVDALLEQLAKQLDERRTERPEESSAPAEASEPAGGSGLVDSPASPERSARPERLASTDSSASAESPVPSEKPAPEFGGAHAEPAPSTTTGLVDDDEQDHQDASQTALASHEDGAKG